MASGQVWRGSGLALIATLACAGALSAESRADSPPLVSGPFVYTSLANDVSPPLRALGPTLPTAPSSVGPTGGGAILGPVESFEGVANDENEGGVQHVPPDTIGAAGPHDYVEWVNDSVAVYDKFGTRELGPMPGRDIWTGFGGPCESSDSGDPIVRYDQLAGRWILAQLGGAENQSEPHVECIAVSTSADPLGTYFRYAFDMPGGFNDYVKLAVWPAGYYMTDDRYDHGAQGSGAFAFDRFAMLAGRPASYVYFQLGFPLFGILPSDLDGTVTPPPGSPDVFVRIDDHRCGFPQDQLELWSFSVDFANPGAATFAQSAVLPVGPFDSTFCGAPFLVPQPGGGEPVDLLTGRMLFRASVREFGSYRSLVGLHADVVAGRAGLRWYEVRYAGPPSTATLYQQGTYLGPEGDTGNRWAGSAAQDATHDIALAFSVDSPTLSPSIAYAGRGPDDPLNELPSGEGRVATGGGVQLDDGHRWGDYSSLTLDPVDGCTFWYAQEYYPATSANAWHTRIGSLRFAGCGALPSISGTAVEGRTLTASPGAWPTLPGASFAYQWRRCDASGAACADIDGATARDYKPVTSDVDGTIRVLVRASTATAEASALSEPTGVIAPTPAAGPLELSTDLAAAPTAVTLGDQVTYTAQVRNSSLTGSATGLAFELKLPAGATLVSASADRGEACVGTTDVTCPLEFLPGGRTATVTVVARPGSRGQQSAVATITADQAATDPSAEQATTAVQVTGNPRLAAAAPLQAVRGASGVTVSGNVAIDEAARLTVRATSGGAALTLLQGSTAGGTSLRNSSGVITVRVSPGTVHLSVRLAPGVRRGRLVLRAVDDDELSTVLSLSWSA